MIHKSDSKHDISTLDEVGYDVDQTSVMNNILGSDTMKDGGGACSESISGVPVQVEKEKEEKEVCFCLFHHLNIRISLSDISVSCISHF